MTIKDKITIYIYRKMTELEQEKESITTQCRLQAMDSLDHYEIMLSKMRIQAFNEFLTDIFNIVINSK